MEDNILLITYILLLMVLSDLYLITNIKTQVLEAHGGEYLRKMKNVSPNWGRKIGVAEDSEKVITKES